MNNQKSTLRWSHFVRLTEHKDGSLIAWNNLTKTIIHLRDLKFKDANKNLERYSEKDKLLKENFFVEKGTNEDLLFANIMNSLKKHVNSKNYNKYLILTTLQCNARCQYCYERGMPSIQMTKETAISLTEYIIKSKTKVNAQLSWYGGEPLLNSEVIDIVTNRLSEEGIQFTSGMTTNGYLFDEKLIEKAVLKWKLQGVQITLDGTNEVYNSTKRYVGINDNPYLRVLQNIRLLLNAGIKVLIRLNLSINNADNLLLLSEELSQTFGKEELLKVVLRILYEYDDDSPYLVKESLLKSFDKILGNLVYNGLYKNTLPKILNQNGCIAENEHCIIIFPNGKLGRCTHYFSNGVIGDIWHGITDKDMVESFKVREKINGKCNKCLFKPDCQLLKKCPQKCDDFYIEWQKLELDYQIRLHMNSHNTSTY